MSNELNIIREGIDARREELQKKFAVKKIGVFGSIAKGSANSKSDIDFLVEFEEPIGLFRFETLRLFLEDCSKKKVDLSTSRALKSIVREEIMNSVIYL